MLDESQIRQWNFQYGKHQKRYLQIFISYIFFTGIVLFCFNTLKIKGILFAYAPFFMSVVYALFLIFYRPYKYTLFIHQISIIFNQSIIILSFGIVSLKNLFPSIKQYYFLIYSYVNLSLCAICLVIFIVRFIYQCKYGVQIFQKQRKDEQEQKIRKIHQKRKKQNKKVQRLIQSKQLKLLNIRNDNKYLMQNQILEEEQINFLNWLKSKPYLSKYERDLLYFQKYEQKPIKWLKIHQKQAYQQRIESKKQTGNVNVKIKANDKVASQDQQLQIIKADLRKSLKYKRLKHQRTSSNSNSKSWVNSQQREKKVKLIQNCRQGKISRKTSYSQQKQYTIRKQNKDSNEIIRPLIVQKNNNSPSKINQKTPQKKLQQHQDKVPIQKIKKQKQSASKKKDKQNKNKNKKY